VLNVYGKTLRGIGVPFERANKLLTGALAIEPSLELLTPLGRNLAIQAGIGTAAIGKHPLDKEKRQAEVSRLRDLFAPELKQKPNIWQGVKGALKSIFTSPKALIPYPGAAKDMPTFGQAVAKGYYEPLMDRKAPGWYAPVVDIAAETAVLGGAQAKAAAAARPYGVAKTGRLTAAEIRAGKKLYSTKGLAKMSPTEIRTAIQQAKVAKLAPPRMPTLAAEGLGPKTKTAVQRLVTSVKQAKRLRPKREAMISREKARRVAMGERIRETKTGKEAALATRGALKGEYSTPYFQPPTIDPADEFYLFESLRTSKMPHFRYRNTADALLKTLTGDLPTRGEIDLLQKHFGKGLAKALLQKRPVSAKAWESLVDLANLPRATLASIDLSFPFRQGIILLPGHPKQWGKSFSQMMKAAVPFKGKKYARYFEDIAENSRYAPLRQKAGLELTQWGLADLTAREEFFMSSWAEMLPGIKWSERTFTTMSNQLRVNVFDDIARNWETAGMTWDNNAEAYTKLASFLNHATGRGTLGERYAKIAPELNAVFFSPRYQVSRPQVVYDAFASLKNPAARKVIVGDTVKFVTTGVAALWLIEKAIPGAEVETDPRSSDFGKVQYGNTRYDFWAGYLPIARLIAQEITGQRKTTGTDKTVDIDRIETIEHFIRMKMSPPAGLAWDILEGKTPIGEEMTFRPTDVKREAVRRVTPMVMQDIHDAIKYQGIDAALPITSTTAFFGVGAQTWEPSKWTLLSREQDRLALETFGAEWEKLSAREQLELRRDNALLSQLKREAKYERTEYPGLERMKQEQLQAGFDIEQTLPRQVQTEFERLKVHVGPVPKTWGEWSLNDERFDQYKKHIAEYLGPSLSRLIKNRTWQSTPERKQRLMIERRIELARNRARKLVRKEANIGRRRRLNK
jgi:hypothetical protein